VSQVVRAFVVLSPDNDSLKPLCNARKQTPPPPRASYTHSHDDELVFSIIAGIMFRPAHHCEYKKR